jgi:hypothetical protein
MGKNYVPLYVSIVVAVLSFFRYQSFEFIIGALSVGIISSVILEVEKSNE